MEDGRNSTLTYDGYRLGAFHVLIPVILAVLIFGGKWVGQESNQPRKEPPALNWPERSGGPLDRGGA